MKALNLLVVDDDPDMRFYLRGCLETLGPEGGRVLEAADGLEAIPLVRSGAVDAVVADVVLPRLDGYGLCRAIKRDPALRRLPVLLVSGEEGRPPEDVGADGFLAKPFNARELHAALEAVLASSR